MRISVTHHSSTSPARSLRRFEPTTNGVHHNKCTSELIFSVQKPIVSTKFVVICAIPVQRTNRIFVWLR